MAGTPPSGYRRHDPHDHTAWTADRGAVATQNWVSLMQTVPVPRGVDTDAPPVEFELALENTDELAA